MREFAEPDHGCCQRSSLSSAAQTNTAIRVKDQLLEAGDFAISIGLPPRDIFFLIIQEIQALCSMAREHAAALEKLCREMQAR